MGEWSEYFEDFPEENPANYVNRRFNPQLAHEVANQENRLTTASKQTPPASTTRIMKAWLEAKSKSFLLPENCPQCGLTELNTYKIHNTFSVSARTVAYMAEVRLIFLPLKVPSMLSVMGLNGIHHS